MFIPISLDLNMSGRYGDYTNVVECFSNLLMLFKALSGVLWPDGVPVVRLQSNYD